MHVKLKVKSVDVEGAHIEESLVEIARVSSGRTDKREEPHKLIQYLFNNGHWSPFEHHYFTVEVVTSRAISAQILRHISMRFQEFSQRYAKVLDFEDIEFRLQAESNRQSSTVPLMTWNNTTGMVEWHNDPAERTDLDYELQRRIENHLEESKDLYEMLVNRGVAKECSRFILPLASRTVIHVTGSIRSWIHFMDQRDDPHAQKEAQQVARAIKRLLVRELPIIAKAKNWQV